MLKLSLLGHWHPSPQTGLFTLWTLLSSTLDGILFNKKMPQCDLLFCLLQIRNYLLSKYFCGLFLNMAFDTKYIEFFFSYDYLRPKSDVCTTGRKTTFVSKVMITFIFIILHAYDFLLIFLPYSMSLLLQCSSLL